MCSCKEVKFVLLETDKGVETYVNINHIVRILEKERFVFLSNFRGDDMIRIKEYSMELLIKTIERGEPFENDTI